MNSLILCQHIVHTSELIYYNLFYINVVFGIVTYVFIIYYIFLFNIFYLFIKGELTSKFFFLDKSPLESLQNDLE